MNLFIAAMLLAVSANNVGVMWIAIEATTIFSALIIPLTLSKASVEASWKYILIGSVGIALAFAGTVLAYFDFVTLSGRSKRAQLAGAARQCATPSIRRSSAWRLSSCWWATAPRPGIAPMHTWKPDAYGESPAPLTALMSSAFFAVALYAVLRWKVVADAWGRPSPTTC